MTGSIGKLASWQVGVLVVDLNVREFEYFMGDVHLREHLVWQLLPNMAGQKETAVSSGGRRETEESIVTIDQQVCGV